VTQKRPRKYFVKEEDGIFTVHVEFFDAIESREEALAIAMRCLGEIHSTLSEEGDGQPFFIGNMKVTTGLQRTLDELEERWPFLMAELYGTTRKINGYTISSC
jgi:hypothetical protein